MPLDLSRTKVFEDRHIGTASQLFAKASRQGYTRGDQAVLRISISDELAAYYHAVYVLARTVEKQVSDISSHHITFHPHLICYLSDAMKHGSIEYLCQVCVCELSH